MEMHPTCTHVYGYICVCMCMYLCMLISLPFFLESVVLYDVFVNRGCDGSSPAPIQPLCTVTLPHLPSRRGAHFTSLESGLAPGPALTNTRECKRQRPVLSVVLPAAVTYRHPREAAVCPSAPGNCSTSDPGRDQPRTQQPSPA